MGFLPKVRTRELVCDFPGLEAAEGSDALTATVRSNLTFGEIDQLPNPMSMEGDQLMYRNSKELRDAIAPYVLSWNCMALNHETGEVEPVPAPADGGPDVFLVVDTLIAVWLGVTLKTIHLRFPDQKKDTEHAGLTGPISPATNSSSKGRPRPSRARPPIS